MTCFKGLAKYFCVRAKYFARVSQGKTRRKREPAAVHGGNVKFWAGSWDEVARWGLGKNWAFK